MAPTTREIAIATERARLAARKANRLARASEVTAIDAASPGDAYRWTCDGEGYSTWFVTDLWAGTCRAMVKTVTRERAAGHVMLLEYIPA